MSEEFVDLIDQENGKLTGKKELKSKAHAKGLWHQAAHVWIVNSRGELLIQKRASDKDSYPNAWDISAAGHVKTSDTPAETAVRETEEELGLKINESDLKHIITYKHSTVLNKNTFFNNEFNYVYLVTLDINPDQINIQKEELADVKFINFKELEKRINQGDKSIVPHKEEFKKLFAVLHKKYS